MVKNILNLLGAVAGFVRRWRPDDPDSPDPAPPPHTGVDPNSLVATSGSAPDPTKDLNLRPSPPGLTLTIEAPADASTTTIGDIYSGQVRAVLDGDPVPKSNQPGSTNPDGLILGDDAKGRVAIEAKYVEDWSRSPYNPDLVYTNNTVRKTIEQAVKYDQAYQGGVEWITNSMDFVKAYAPRFKAAGVENFHFTVIPAVRRVAP